MGKYEKGSIESIAMAQWGEYQGDMVVIKALNDALRDNFIEGFKQGVMLRLTGEDDAHG